MQIWFFWINIRSCQCNIIRSVPLIRYFCSGSDWEINSSSDQKWWTYTHVYASISFYSIHCLFLIQFHCLCVLARLAREIFSVRFIKDIPWLSLSLSHFVKCIYLKTIAVDTYQVVLFPLRVYLYSLKWKFATSVIKFSLLILWVVYCFTRLFFFFFYFCSV